MLFLNCIIIAAAIIAFSLGDKIIEISSKRPELCVGYGFPDLPAKRAIGEILDDSASASSLAMKCRFQKGDENGVVLMEIIVPSEPFGFLAISGRINSSLHDSEMTCNMDDNSIHNHPQMNSEGKSITVTYRSYRFNFNITLLGLHNAPVRRNLRSASLPHIDSSDTACVLDSVMPADSKSYYPDLGNACDLDGDTKGRLMYDGSKNSEVICSMCCGLRVWSKLEGRCVFCPTRPDPHIFTTCTPSFSSKFATPSTPATAVFPTNRTPDTSENPVVEKDPCDSLSLEVPKNVKIVKLAPYYVDVACDRLPINKCYNVITYEFEMKHVELKSVKSAKFPVPDARFSVPDARFLIPDAAASYSVHVRANTSSGWTSWSAHKIVQAMPDDKNGDCDASLSKTGNTRTVKIHEECEWSPINDKSAMGIKVRFKPVWSTHADKILNAPGNDTLTFKLPENGTFDHLLEFCIYYKAGDGRWTMVKQIAQGVKQTAQGSSSASILGNLLRVLAIAAAIAYVVL